MNRPKLAAASAAALLWTCVPPALAQPAGAIEYRVLATSRTATMQKEMQAAAEAGFRFGDVMGGDTAFGGSEVVVIMLKDGAPGSYGYRLLAANRTSTMQRELQQAGDEGYEYRGQTVFTSAFGGSEVVVILERDGRNDDTRFEYRLVATSKTSTLQKELSEAGRAGFDFVGLTVGQTAIGGNEVVAILRRKARPGL
jgi:hypothetical protein